MRAFIALEIPGEIRTYLQSIIKSMAIHMDGVKWVNREGQHVTLKFFGEIEETKAFKIRETISHIEKRYAPFVVTLKGIDAFPGKKRARVIVATLEKGVDNIRGIFNDIEDNLSMIGVEKEKRDFTPHVTLGRRKMPMPLLDRDMARLEERSFVLDNLVLFSSTLTREGAIYNPVWGIKLGGEESEGRE